MQRRRVLWLLCMAGLCLVLYTIVISRVENRTDVIFGGADGAYIRSDSVSFLDPNKVETPEPTEDIWPQIDITLTQYSMVNVDNLLSPRYTPDVDTISITNYQLFSTAAMPYLDALIEDLQEHGFSVYVAGAYRSYSYQEKLFNGKARSPPAWASRIIWIPAIRKRWRRRRPSRPSRAAASTSWGWRWI